MICKAFSCVIVLNSPLRFSKQNKNQGANVNEKSLPEIGIIHGFSSIKDTLIFISKLTYLFKYQELHESAKYSLLWVLIL